MKVLRELPHIVMANSEQQRSTFAETHAGYTEYNEAESHVSWMRRRYTPWDTPTGGVTSETGGKFKIRYLLVCSLTLLMIWFLLQC